MNKNKIKDSSFINIDELIFDVIIASGIFFIGNVLVKERNFTDILGEEILSNLIIVIDFVLSYYLGKSEAKMINKDFLKTSADFKLKQLIVPAVFAVVSIYTLFVLWISLPIVLKVPGIFTFVLGIIVIIIGAATGLTSGTLNLANDKNPELTDNQETQKPASSFFLKYLNEKTISRHPSFILPVLFFLYVLIFIFSKFGSSTGIMALLIIVVALIVAILSIFLSGGIIIIWIIFYEAVVARVPIVDKIFRKLIVPFFIAVILMLWEHLYLLSAVDDFQQVNILKIVLVLMFTGIIPLRIVMFLKPPVKIANLIMAVIAISFYIYSIQYLIL